MRAGACGGAYWQLVGNQALEGKLWWCKAEGEVSGAS